MKKKSLAAMVTSAVMVMAMLTGCGSGETQATAQAAEPSSAVESAEAAEPEAVEETGEEPAKDVAAADVQEIIDRGVLRVGVKNAVIGFGFQDELTGEEFLALKTRVLEISKETRAVNSIGDLNGALDDMPHYCITIGINEISHARKIRLGCFRDWHRSVVRRAAYGEPTAHFPVSLLQSHPDINLKFTEFVANLPE